MIRKLVPSFFLIALSGLLFYSVPFSVEADNSSCVSVPGVEVPRDIRLRERTPGNPRMPIRDTLVLLSGSSNQFYVEGLYSDGVWRPITGVSTVTYSFQNQTLGQLFSLRDLGNGSISIDGNGIVAVARSSSNPSSTAYYGAPSVAIMRNITGQTVLAVGASLSAFTPTGQTCSLVKSYPVALVSSLPVEASSTFRITFPQGGEEFHIGDQQTITWTASGFPNSSTLDLFLFQNSSSLSTIISRLPLALGQFSWTVPSVSSGGSLFIKGVTSEGVIGQSNNYFSILLPDLLSVYDLKTPSLDDEVWQIGSRHTIRWAGGRSTDSLLLKLDAEDDSQDQTIAFLLSNPGSYNWSIPVTIPSGRYRFELFCNSCSTGTSSYAASRWFSVTPTNDQLAVTVISPNGGEVWDRGSTQAIQWRKNAVPSGATFLLFVENPQSIRTSLSPFAFPIRSSSSVESASWTIPTTLPTGTYHLFVSCIDPDGIHYCNGNSLDASDSTFSISVPFVNQPTSTPSTPTSTTPNSTSTPTSTPPTPTSTPATSTTPTSTSGASPWLAQSDQLFTPSGVRKVGLGTQTPDFPLTIQAFTGSDPNFSRVFSFQDQSGARKWHLNFINGGLNFVQSGVADYRLFLAQNGNVGIGLSTPQAKLEVNGTFKVGSLSTDPQGVNGMIYYNTTMNKFRCYKNSQWINCIP